MTVAVKNTVVELTRANGKRTVYISVLKRHELLFALHHKLRVKSIIYDCHVTVYSPDMCFENAIKAGSIITVDNRSSYKHDVVIVPIYSKKVKHDRGCSLCGK